MTKRNNKNGKTRSKNRRGMRNRMRGSGAYTLPRSAKAIGAAAAKSLRPVIKKALRAGGSALGGVVGRKFGNAALGSRLGGKLGARISRLIGSGDYTSSERVSYNSLFPSATREGALSSFGSTNSSVRIKHREYLDDVYSGGSNAFSINAWPIQPGLAATFQYLSQIATNFEEYVFHGLVFEYVSTTSPYFSAGAMGSVIMSCEYDPTLPAYTSKPQMENSDFAISARPDTSMLFGIECKDQPVSGRYVRTTQVGQPLSMTDMGNFYLATQTQIAEGTILGELWVTYDIEFRKPHISPARYGIFRASTVNGTTAFKVNSSYGALLNTTITGTGSTYTVTFPDANIGDIYLITQKLTAVGTGAALAAVSTSTGVSLSVSKLSTYQIWQDKATTGLLGHEYVVSTPQVFQTNTLSVNSNSTVPSVTFTHGTLTGTLVVDFMILTIANGIPAANLFASVSV